MLCTRSNNANVNGNDDFAIDLAAASTAAVVQVATSLNATMSPIEETDDNADDSNDKSGIQVFAAIASNVFLFFLIFGLSATVDVKNLRHQLTNKFALGCGVAMQFLIMPLLGCLAVYTLKNHGFTQAMGITLLVVTSSPGGSYSNWWCSTFNAELALSVAMTTVSSILSIAFLPANLMLYTYLTYGVGGGSKSTNSERDDVDTGTFWVILISKPCSLVSQLC